MRKIISIILVSLVSSSFILVMPGYAYDPNVCWCSMDDPAYMTYWDPDKNETLQNKCSYNLCNPQPMQTSVSEFYNSTSIPAPETPVEPSNKTDWDKIGTATAVTAGAAVGTWALYKGIQHVFSKGASKAVNSKMVRPNYNQSPEAYNASSTGAAAVTIPATIAPSYCFIRGKRFRTDYEGNVYDETIQNTYNNYNYNYNNAPIGRVWKDPYLMNYFSFDLFQNGMTEKLFIDEYQGRVVAQDPIGNLVFLGHCTPCSRTASPSGY